MSGYLVSSASRTPAELARIQSAGRIDLRIDNKGSEDVLIFFTRWNNARGGSRSASSDAETFKSQTVSDAEALSYPVLPNSLSLSSSDTAVPTLKDRDGDGVLRVDRDLNTSLADGIDGVTSVAATKTLTSATGDFVNDGVLVGDKVVLSDGSDACIRTISGVTSTVLTVSEAWPEGSQTAVTFKVFPEDINCGSVDHYSGVLDLNYPGPNSPGGKATILGTVAFPINLDPGDTITADVDGAGAATATFDATQAIAAGDQGGALGVSASETLVLSSQGGEDQTITFGAGTESTAVQYKDVINATLVGAVCISETNSLTAMIGSLNEIKADYTAHIADTDVHSAADTANPIAAADATNLATGMVLANELKADYNAHRSEAGVHVNNDAGNAITAANATDLASLVTLVAELKLDINAHLIAASNLEEAITLVNDIKTQYEAHRILIGGSEHVNVDSVNDITAANATNLATALTLVNDIKAQYNLHLAALSEVEEAILLANDLKTQYEAHRVLIAGGEHGAADSTNVVTAADATDQATAITLANDLKVQYEAHRVLIAGGEHSGADATNVIAAANASDLATLLTLLNELKLDYEAHRILTAGPVHGAADTINAVSALDVGSASVHLADDTTNTVTSADATDLATLTTLANEIQLDYEAHRIDTTSHGAADATNAITAVAVGTAGIHLQDDTTNTITSMPDSISIYANQYGSGSAIEVVSGSGTILDKLGLAVGSNSGTGDAANINAVTFAEAKALIEEDIKTAVAGDLILCSSEGGSLRITNTTATTEASSTLTIGGTARTKFGLDASAHAGDDADAELNVSATYVQSALISAGTSETRSLINLPGEELVVGCACESGSSQLSLNWSISS